MDDGVAEGTLEGEVPEGKKDLFPDVGELVKSTVGIGVLDSGFPDGCELGLSVA